MTRWANQTEPTLPALMQPTDLALTEPAFLVEHLNLNRLAFRKYVADSGAVLLRGFNIQDTETFATIVKAISPNVIRYLGGDARRTRLSDFVYTANDSAGHIGISPHNELGYSLMYPRLVFFYCKTPPASGGSMPLVDGRRLLSMLKQRVALDLDTLQVTYIQNLPSEPDLGPQKAKTWQATFETDSRQTVESILETRAATFQWLRNEILHIEETVPATLKNPVTGEEALFCQADRWNASLISDERRDAIISIPAKERYHHCTLGDGSEFSDADLSEMQYLKSQLAEYVHWQKGDILCVDNIVTLHGRAPFVGDREFFAAMTSECEETSD